MNRALNKRRWSAVMAATATIAVVGVLTAQTPGATAAPAAADDRSGAQKAQVAPGQLAAMQRDLGLTKDEAKQRLVQEAKATSLDRTLTAELGGSLAGSWFDAKTGKLAVAVTSAAAADKAAQAGAKVKVVKNSLAELVSIKKELDAQSPKAAAASGIAATSVDELTNTVVITTVKGKQSAAAAALKKHGQAVRVETIPALPQFSAQYLDGGEAIYMAGGGRCSVGFNMTISGQPRMITAGHCADSASPVRGWDGSIIGDWVVRSFRDGNDYATTTVNTTNWIQGPWVALHTPADDAIVVNGSAVGPVGGSLCKSGSTTRWTCGVVNSYNNSVNVGLASGEVVRVDQLTRHSACVEQGDSGGANMWGGQAQGVSSAAVLYTTSNRCGSAVGQPTISWFQPINEALSTWGYVLHRG